MKTKNTLKTFFTAAALSTAFIFTACDKNDDVNDNQYAVSGNASGSQEVPAVAGSGTATLSGNYDARNNTLTYTVNWNGLSDVVTGAHIHGPATAGVNADVVHSLMIATNGINGTAGGTLVLADSTEAHLLSGKLYYNLHTLLNPNGEIRGQIATTGN